MVRSNSKGVKPANPVASSLSPVLLPAGKSLLLSLRNVYETLAVSAPTVVDAYRQRLTPEACNERLESWA